jgi:dolichyl-phosphate-mannose--protein O-mannosyl transferase
MLLCVFDLICIVCLKKKSIKALAQKYFLNVCMYMYVQMQILFTCLLFQSLLNSSALEDILSEVVPDLDLSSLYEADLDQWSDLVSENKVRAFDHRNLQK